MNILESLFNQIEATTENYIADAFTAVSGMLGTTATVFFILYMCIYGFMMMFGKVTADPRQLFYRLGIGMLIYAFMFSWDWYSKIFVNTFTSIPDGLAGALMNSHSGGTASEALSMTFDKIIEASEIAAKGGGSFDLVGPYIQAGLIIIVGVAYVAYATFLIVMSKLVLSILLGIGSIFILMAFFQPLRGLFSSWLMQCINYVFVGVLTFAILALFNTYVDQMITYIVNSGEVTWPNIGYFVLVSVFITLVLMQVTSIASGISGGFSMSTGGWEDRLARSGFRFASGKASQGAGAIASGAKSTGSRVREGAQKASQVLFPPNKVTRG